MSGAATGRGTIPHNEPAERALLGAVLVNPTSLPDVAHLVAREDFHRPSHGDLFAAMIEMDRDGIVPDPVTVAGRLDPTTLKALGGAGELTSLQNAAPSRDPVRYVADVKAAARRRRAMGIAAEASIAASTGDDAALSAAVARLADIANSSSSGRRLSTVTLGDVEAEQVHWLWYPRVAYGKVTLLAGEPGAGKSFVTMSLAAHVTLGQVPIAGGNDDRGPGHVVLLNYEDDTADTIRPRADQAGADVARITVVEGVRDDGGRVIPFHAGDVELLDKELSKRPDVRLVVIDPFASFAGAGTDTNRDTDVRAVLDPLVALAATRQVACLIVLHTRKGEADRVIHRVSGSLGGLVGTARSVLLAGRDPHTGRRAVCHIKANNEALAEPLEFVLDHDGLSWLGEAPELDAERLVGPGPRPDAPDTKLAACQGWLADLLADGPVARNDIRGRAEKEDPPFSWMTVRRAFEAIGADSYQERSAGHRGAGRSMWFLDSGSSPRTPEADEQPNRAAETPEIRASDTSGLGLLAQTSVLRVGEQAEPNGNGSHAHVGP